MPLTEPFDVCVVRLPHNAVAVAPKRTSLPSRFGPGAASPANATLGWFSAQMANVDSPTDSAIMMPRMYAARRLRPVT